MAIINICCVVLGVIVGLSLISGKSWRDRLLVVFQLSPLVEGIDSLRSGKQTMGLVAGKKVDAMARSMPSMFLQTFSLLVSLSTISTTGYITLIVSIVLGSTTTLATLAPSSGRRLFSSRFLLHLMYFFSELLLRVILISIMFVSIRGIAFVVVSVD